MAQPAQEEEGGREVDMNLPTASIWEALSEANTRQKSVAEVDFGRYHHQDGENGQARNPSGSYDSHDSSSHYIILTFRITCFALEHKVLLRRLCDTIRSCGCYVQPPRSIGAASLLRRPLDRVAGVPIWSDSACTA